MVYQEARRWVAAKVFKAIAHDLRLVVRLNDDRSENPSAIILDAWTLQSKRLFQDRFIKLRLCKQTLQASILDV
ncbi:MAG: hypothetical protein ACK58L_17460, partial [Planctomycetota bacterium]